MRLRSWQREHPSQSGGILFSLVTLLVVILVLAVLYVARHRLAGIVHLSLHICEQVFECQSGRRLSNTDCFPKFAQDGFGNHAAAHASVIRRPLFQVSR